MLVGRKKKNKYLKLFQLNINIYLYNIKIYKKFNSEVISNQYSNLIM